MNAHCRLVALCVVAVISLAFNALPAGAGILSLDCTVDCPTHSGALNWQWGLQENGSDAWVNVAEQFGDEFGDEYKLMLSGETDTDPMVSFVKTVTNTSSSSWIGYSIALDPGGVATFAGTPTSDAMTLASQTSTMLTFGLPAAITPGQTVNFYFDVNIPSTGPFNVSISQAPAIDEHVIPEPATISLVALAAVALAFGRRTLV